MKPQPRITHPYADKYRRNLLIDKWVKRVTWIAMIGAIIFITGKIFGIW